MFLFFLGMRDFENGGFVPLKQTNKQTKLKKKAGPVTASA